MRCDHVDVARGDAVRIANPHGIEDDLALRDSTVAGTKRCDLPAVGCDIDGLAHLGDQLRLDSTASSSQARMRRRRQERAWRDSADLRNCPPSQSSSSATQHLLQSPVQRSHASCRCVQSASCDIIGSYVAHLHGCNDTRGGCPV